VKIYGQFERRTAGVLIGGADDGVQFEVKEMPQAAIEVIFEIVADSIMGFFGLAKKARAMTEAGQTENVETSALVDLVREILSKRLREVCVFALCWTLPGKTGAQFSTNYKKLPDGYEASAVGLDLYLREHATIREFEAILEAFLDVNDLEEIVGKGRSLVAKVTSAVRTGKTVAAPTTTPEPTGEEIPPSVY
jgi:hypothetical protein